ncbi:leucine-rich repeat-containing protein 42-like [Actinia tenebrosa]|uniref:Leucine-rich repeat-containing protein 42-like n=1 Tax=Actinia tenebrosa TaxID=6105 RepID=A0A6P8I098_ACTTE|nr:leucine-rich repeat-containing protein 42-like [Actinia tenebrosa]
MPFSSRRLGDLFPREDEVGLYYTRDKYGQLQVPPGYELSTKENVKKHLIDSEPKAASCSLKVQNGNSSPTSLFSICLDFVAKNITIVESLCGFPEIVGKELFNRVQINGGFPKGCQQNLQLFCDAYGSVVLSKLSLKYRYLEVNEVDYLRCFPCLTELDLSHCLLGSDHELLAHVAKVTSLLKLSLKDNGLNDSDLKCLTLPLRVMGAGPLTLSTLDLSCNPDISNLSVRYLTTFSKLTSLNLSGTSVTMAGVSRLTAATNLKFSPTSTEFFSENAIKTEGWASPVIDDWLSNSKRVLQSKSHDTANEKAKSFYPKKTKCNILKSKRIIKTRDVAETQIILTADKRTINENLDKSSVENEKKNTKLFKKSLMANLASSAIKRKSASSNQDSEGSDDDLMKSYLTSNVKVDKKRKICLADLTF